MKLCLAHVRNDPNPECARYAPSPAEVACCSGGHVAVRLLARSSSRGGGAAHRRRASGAAATAASPQAIDLSGCGGARRARPAVIVVDASAMLEALLQTPAAPAVRRRLFVP